MMQEQDEDPRYLSEQIITYLGNKRHLLHLLREGVRRVQQALGKSQLDCFDAFSGSGIVSRFLKQYARRLFCNDLEEYSRILNTCYLANADQQPEHLPDILARLNQHIREHWAPGFITDMYAPEDDEHILPGERVFYTRRNAIYLDTARQAIQRLEPTLQPFFLAPLLHQASVHTNTGGIFKGFYKNEQGTGQFGGRGRHALSRIMAPIALELPVFSRFQAECHILRQEATNAASSLPPLDLAYLDPPYNQHPYGSNYFMLNLLTSYEKPEFSSQVSGIPVGWHRSPYNKKKCAAQALGELLETLPARYILISYNSEGFISPAEMKALLLHFGPTERMEQHYPTFRAGRNRKTRANHVTEHLYLLHKGTGTF